jgi:PAS domain-containing protein
MQVLTNEEERWRVALQDAVFGLWDLDPRNERVHYTPQWKARLGFPRIDSADSTAFWRSLVHPDDFNPMLRALRLHLDGYTHTYEARFRLRAGNFRYLPVLSRGRAVERDERGHALRMVGTMVDLTQRWPTPASREPLVQLHREGTSPMDAMGTPLPHQASDLLERALRDGSE